MPQPRRSAGGATTREADPVAREQRVLQRLLPRPPPRRRSLRPLRALGRARQAGRAERAHPRPQPHASRSARYRADAALTAPDADLLDAGTLDLGDLRADAKAALLALNDAILTALGWAPDRDADPLTLTSGEKTITVPAAHIATTPTGVLLVALDTVFATDPAAVIASKATPAGRLVEPVLLNDKPAARTALEAAQLIFTADDAPSYLLLVSGGAITLLDRERWGEGISIGANLDDALARHDTKPKGELAAIAALFGAGAINPGDQAQSVLTSLLEKASTESAGVSKELRHGIRRSVELLANAVVEDVRERQKGAWMSLDPKDLTRQSLRYLYRIIVLLFAEARPELGILPVDDPDYQAGYSVARLRDVALVDLQTPHGLHGRHIQQSLDVLFRLVNDGHDPDQGALGDDARDLVFPGLRSTLFDEKSCALLDKAHLHDGVLQQVIQHLCFTRERAGRGRQPVSYSTLGINQLGAVYEGLMAYSGFLATEPLFEIDKDGDPDNGSWVIPVDRADEFPEEVFLKETLPDGSERRVRYEEGEFVFRLSGRDRQRSASYYTPEVLTEFTVRHALDVLFEENPDLTAKDILNLTVCEPALGSGAFLTEAVTQLASRYLKAAQDESGEVIDADQYQLELQRAKAHFAVNQAYGVDLNQTAVELAEVSLWLACMHDGLQAPWFGARLRRGNSLVGARRETYTREQIAATAWAGKKATAPTAIAISETPLGDAPGIHHFLVPARGGAPPPTRRRSRSSTPTGSRQSRSGASRSTRSRPAANSTGSRCLLAASRSCGPSPPSRSIGSGRRPASTSTYGAHRLPRSRRAVRRGADPHRPPRPAISDLAAADPDGRLVLAVALGAPARHRPAHVRRVAHRRRGAPADRRALGVRCAVRRRARAHAPGGRVDRRHRRRPPVARERPRDRHDPGLVSLGARVRTGVRTRRLRPPGR